jgi:hypothetical protein
MSEREGRVHLVYGFNGTQVLCECREGGWMSRQEFAAHSTAAHDDRIRAEEREGWASWLESWLSAIGPEPPTVEGVLRWLRADSRPFGVRAAAGTPTHHNQKEGT